MYREIASIFDSIIFGFMLLLSERSRSSHVNTLINLTAVCGVIALGSTCTGVYGNLGNWSWSWFGLLRKICYKFWKRILCSMINLCVEVCASKLCKAIVIQLHAYLFVSYRFLFSWFPLQIFQSTRLPFWCFVEATIEMIFAILHHFRWNRCRLWKLFKILTFNQAHNIRFFYKILIA